MKIETFAKNMAEKYKDSETKWLLDLKRLQIEGYSIIPTRDTMVTREDGIQKIFCSGCGREVIPHNGKILEYHGKTYCHHCIFRMVVERNLP